MDDLAAPAYSRLTVWNFDRRFRFTRQEVAEEVTMTRHLSRFELARSVVAAASALLVCTAVLFGAAHHLAG